MYFFIAVFYYFIAVWVFVSKARALENKNKNRNQPNTYTYKYVMGSPINPHFCLYVGFVDFLRYGGSTENAQTLFPEANQRIYTFSAYIILLKCFSFPTFP